MLAYCIRKVYTYKLLILRHIMDNKCKNTIIDFSVIACICTVQDMFGPRSHSPWMYAHALSLGIISILVVISVKCVLCVVNV